MKIKNEYILVNNGQKQVKLHNTILNTYINKIIANQLDIDPDSRHTLLMGEIYIKFETPLTFNKDSILQESDFDIRLHYYTMNNDITPTRIIYNYFYKIDSSIYSIYKISTQTFITDYSEYIGKKITAIGFGELHQNQGIVYACVDTSTYNLYIENSEEIFSVARRDIITTDTIFYSNSNLIRGPLHLCNGQFHYDSNQFMDFTYIGILESIGVGVTKAKLDNEKTLIPYNQHLDISEQNKIKINDEFTIDYEADGLFPALDLYPAEDIWPERIIEEPIYPSNEIYPGEEQYMLSVPYQYLQLKYRVYENETIEGTLNKTSIFYILSKKIERNNKIKMEIEYEN